MKRVKLFLRVGVLLSLLLSACSGLPFDLPWITEDLSTPTAPVDVAGEATPAPDPTQAVEATPAPIDSLTIWVPPDMDPELKTEATILFQDRLEAFSADHDGIEVHVRVKPASGAGGLLDALTASSAAAPDSLPDLIALTRADLETAALKGLISSMDGMTEIPDDADWYGFTRNMALIQGSTFSLPFAADALVLVYRPEYVLDPPHTWSDLFDEKLELVFPAEHDQALFPMTMYLAEGGKLQDSQRRPQLELAPLTEVFRLFEQGVQTGAFPDWLNQYQSSSQVWTAFNEGQIDLAVTWVSYYLQEAPPDAMIAPLFPGSEETFSMGTGLSWSLASPYENRHPLAVKLAEYLVQSEFLAEWTRAAGYLPPRPSALEGWTNQKIRATLSQIAMTAVLRPPNEVILALGPFLRDGSRQVLQGLTDPAQAAQLVIEGLGE
ncbi:MAG: extracellular solute-binding protein [Chloroflexi bacterium]|nr:extracellular solute-binding protein [Chloroflexota bacterium]